MSKRMKILMWLQLYIMYLFDIFLPVDYLWIGTVVRMASSCCYCCQLVWQRGVSNHAVFDQIARLVVVFMVKKMSYTSENAL